MAYVFCFIGVSGFFFCAAFERQINAFYAKIIEHVKKNRNVDGEFTKFQQELAFVRALIRALRSGSALETALIKISKDSSISSMQQISIQNLIHEKDCDSFLFEFLRISAKKGQPILMPLQIYSEKLTQIIKIRKKISSLVAQAKAQAEILSWLPILLFLVLFIIDGENVWQILNDPLCLFLLSLVFCLIGIGKKWIYRLQNNLFLAKDMTEKIELEMHPELILMMVTEISSGLDTLSSWENSFRWLTTKQPKVEYVIKKNPSIKHLKYLAEESALTGAPIKEELLALLSESLFHAQSKYEERANQLPVKLLAPLFLCFLPACFLTLAIYFLPIFSQI
jgi:hypothetical protein